MSDFKCELCNKFVNSTFRVFVCESCYIKEREELIREFLKDWTSLFPVKPIASPYIHYTISDISYLSIKKKWEKMLK